MIFPPFLTMIARAYFAPVPKYPIGSSMFLILTCTVFFYYYEKQMNQFAVVIPGQVSVRSGFSENSTELFVLHSGTKVKVEKIKGDYLRIFFAKGKTGWLKKKSCQII